MRESNVRVRQLKNIKTKSYFFLFLNFVIFTCVYFLVLLILILLNKKGYIISFNKNNLLNDKVFYIMTSIFFVFIILESIFLLHLLNKKYTKLYLNYLFSECKLDEIYFFINKVSKNKKLCNQLQNYYQINKIKTLQSYSNASTKFLLEISNIAYKYQKNYHQGVILHISFEQSSGGYLRLCKHIFNNQDDQNLKRYGFPLQSLLSNYQMETSFTKEAYILEDNKINSCIISFERFLKQNIDFILKDDSIFILINDYHLRIADSMFKPINDNSFQEKIEALETFHRLSFAMIEMFFKVFISKSE